MTLPVLSLTETFSTTSRVLEVKVAVVVAGWTCDWTGGRGGCWASARRGGSRMIAIVHCCRVMLVLRGPLDVIDDDELSGTLRRFQF